MEKNYAVLQLDLDNTIPAYDFGTLVSIIDGLYSTFLWLDKEDNYDIMPALYFPTEEEKLYIQRVEIGTPNVMELVGIGEHLYNAVYFLAHHFHTVFEIGTVTMVAVEKSNTILDFFDKVKGIFKKKEKPKIETDTTKSELELKVKSLEIELERLLAMGKINFEIKGMKDDYIKYVATLKNYTNNIVSSSSMTLVRTSGTSSSYPI